MRLSGNRHEGSNPSISASNPRFLPRVFYFSPGTVLSSFPAYPELSLNSFSFEWSDPGELIGYLHFPLTMLMNFVSFIVGILLFFSSLLLILFVILSVTVKSTRASCIFHRIAGVMQSLHFLITGGCGICFIIPSLIINVI